MGVIKEVLEQEKIQSIKKKKWGREEWLIVILAGIFLLIVFWPESDSDKGDENHQSISEAGSNSNEEYNKSVSYYEEAYQSNGTISYKVQLEEQLEDTLERMDGIESAEVMITLKTSEEEVVLKDVLATKEFTREEDNLGGIREIESESTQETVCYAEGVNETNVPFITYTVFPKVEGVLIVVGGNKTDYLRTQIVSAVQALFDVENHKVVVIKMKES